MTERKDRLYILEEEVVAKTAEPSCTPAQIAREVLGIQGVRGLMVVDLAAGASPLTAKLIAEGADAHAVDAIYNMSAARLSHLAADYLDRQVEDAPFDYREIMRSEGELAIQEFLDSLQSNGENYHQSYLTRLPFRDNFSDLTVSLNGILSVSEEPELTVEMVKEALRITKPGGKLVMTPVHLPNDPYFNYFADEHSAVIEQLEREGERFELETVAVSATIPLPEFNRLTIIKS